MKEKGFAGIPSAYYIIFFIIIFIVILVLASGEISELLGIEFDPLFGE